MGDRSYSSNSSSDDRYRNDEGHFQWNQGMILAGRYEVTRLLGDGTFGRVLEARDTRDGTMKAIKVIRAVSRYIESAKQEAQVLTRLQEADPEGNSKIVRLYDTFDLVLNYCLVFEILGRSLFDVIKWNDYYGRIKTGFRMAEVKAIARQCFQALEFMHTKRLTHTDLKPENILFVYDEFDPDTRPVTSEEESAPSTTP
jgi:serine/threonine protein kinase